MASCSLRLAFFAFSFVGAIHAVRLKRNRGSSGAITTSTASSGLEVIANSSATQHYSTLNRCSPTSHCTVPRGQTWILDASLHAASLLVEGTLKWDTSKDGLEIRTGSIVVDGGVFEIGTKQSPMSKKATVYINAGGGGADSEHMGSRVIGGMNNATIRIHGRPLARTWTLLSATAQQGTKVLKLKDDPAAMGWRIGDRIGIAQHERADGARGTEAVIASLGPFEVRLSEALPREHWGGFRDVAGRRFELAAEVVNLERSILLTGDRSEFDSHHKGWHLMVGHGSKVTKNVLDIRYARTEVCGQQGILGRYCIHMHLLGQCPECVVQGNALADGWQGGITIHGTHKSLVDQNVMWDMRAFGIYIEDGNEMNNTLSNNVAICSVSGMCNTDWALWGGSGSNHWAGIYMIGMTNDLIGNRVAGYNECIWTEGSASPHGKSYVLNKVCPVHSPFGKIKGNVCHSNLRFGIYPDNQYPRNIKRDENGLVTDMASCNAHTPDGKDNGLRPANVIEDQFDWNNLFVGQYAMGDISYVNFTSVNNHHGMYWKTSKNFADGTSYHVRDSIFADSFLGFLGPAGPFTFKMRNVKFIGGSRHGIAALVAGQHCGLPGAGSPCNVQYLLEKVDFSGVSEGVRRIDFGVNCMPSAKVLPVFLAEDDSLGGFRSIVSRNLNGFAKVSGCQALGSVWNNAIGCSIAARHLDIWGKELPGGLQLSGPGYDVSPNWGISNGLNAGHLSFDGLHQGYGAVVLANQQYTLSSNGWSGSEIIRFSDRELVGRFEKTSEQVILRIGSQQCTLRASDERGFLHEGRYARNREGASQGACKAAIRAIAASPTPPTPSPTPSPPAPSPTPSRPTPSPRPPGGEPTGKCEFGGSIPGTPTFWDPSCVNGGVGCKADGKNNECRFCGAAHFPACP